MSSIDGVSAITYPWGRKDAAAYDRACREAEVRSTLHRQSALTQLLGYLDFDKAPRISGAGGRVVIADITALHLRAGDIMTPSPSCPDVRGEP